MIRDWKITEKGQQQIMWDNVKLGNSILIFFLFFAYGSVVMQGARSIVMWSLQDHDNGRNVSISKPMYILSKFHFETQSSPVFEIIWICQFIAAALSITAYASFDGFFIFSILHVCAQLTNLQFDLKNIPLQRQSKKQNFICCLRSIIERHIHLYR